MKKQTIQRQALKKYLNQLLRPFDFQDYGPNGLQIEGKEEIHKIAFAVSATKDSVATSVSENADALIVHHGLFWKFHGPKTITGPFAKRVKPLIQNEINLFGYHLPLDAHIEVGNAASLAHLLKLDQLTPFGDYKGCPTGVSGRITQPFSALELKTQLEKILDHPVMMAAEDDQTLCESIGIITGGANGDWSLANKLGLDCFLTGEMSEHDWNEAKEAGIVMFAGGHHATERFGIQTLMKKIETDLLIDCFFIDSENPA